MGYGQDTSLYAILYHVCSNQSGRSEQSDTLSTHFVFLNTTCGERKFAYSQITINSKTAAVNRPANRFHFNRTIMNFVDIEYIFVIRQS